MEKGKIMKKSSKWAKIAMVAMLTASTLAIGMLTGCQGAPAADGTQTAAAAVQDENLKQAGIGGLAMLYDNTVWNYDETKGTDSSMVFTAKDGSILGVSASKEPLYQHPLEMIHMANTFVSTYENFEEVKAPNKIEVNDSEWYEWEYSYTEDGKKEYTYQRYYGKNYYAYTLSYTAYEEDYEKNINQALQVMNSVAMDVPDNAEREEKSKEFLVGEWDFGAKGYVVFNQDGTYEWYAEATKDTKNMHKGTYAGDIENKDIGFSEGAGIYFVVFPEVLYGDGQEMTTASAKYDYAVNIETQQEDGSYQVLNAVTFDSFNIKKVK